MPEPTKPPTPAESALRTLHAGLLEAADREIPDGPTTAALQRAVGKRAAGRLEPELDAVRHIDQHRRALTRLTARTLEDQLPAIVADLEHLAALDRRAGG